MMNALKKAIALVFGLGLALSIAGTATAATSADAEVEITALEGGGLSASITGVTFASVPYSFTDTTRTGNFVISALDNRGTADGWHITLKATDFENGDASRSFAVNQLSLAAGTVVTNSGNNATGSGNMTMVPLNPVTPSPVEIWSAEEGYGDGDYTLTSVGTLVVPGGTLVDTYSSEVTVAIETGP